MRKLILFLFLLAPLPVYATTSAVSEYSLSNGLKILVKEDHRAPVAIAQVWYKIGSSYESNGTNGVSHALEHMMFRGTKKYGPGMLDKIVVENGGLHNAFTGNDQTCYFEILPVNKLDLILELESDRMRGLLLDDADFLKEKQVILEERKTTHENSPYAQIFERFQAAAFASNPYHTPVIGWMHDIQNLTALDLKNWYQNWYAPNNAILVVVGDVKPEQVFRMAKKYFGKLSSNKLSPVKIQKEIEPLGQRNIVVKVPAKVPYLMMGYNVPTLKTTDQKWKPYALNVLCDILSGSDSSRIPKELIRKQKIATDAWAGYNPFDRLDNVLMFAGTPVPGHTIKELEQAFLYQIKKLQTTLVTSEELSQVKTRAIANKTYAKDSIVAAASEIGGLEAVGLKWTLADQYVENIKAVTPKQIRAVAKEFLITDRLTVAELQPLTDKYAKKQK